MCSTLPTKTGGYFGRRMRCRGADIVAAVATAAVIATRDAAREVLSSLCRLTNTGAVLRGRGSATAAPGPPARGGGNSPSRPRPAPRTGTTLATSRPRCRRVNVPASRLGLRRRRSGTRARAAAGTVLPPPPPRDVAAVAAAAAAWGSTGTWPDAATLTTGAILCRVDVMPAIILRFYHTTQRVAVTWATSINTNICAFFCTSVLPPCGQYSYGKPTSKA